MKIINQSISRSIQCWVAVLTISLWSGGRASGQDFQLRKGDLLKLQTTSRFEFGYEVKTLEVRYAYSPKVVGEARWQEIVRINLKAAERIVRYIPAGKTIEFAVDFFDGRTFLVIYLRPTQASSSIEDIYINISKIDYSRSTLRGVLERSGLRFLLEDETQKEIE